MMKIWLLFQRELKETWGIPVMLLFLAAQGVFFSHIPDFFYTALTNPVILTIPIAFIFREIITGPQFAKYSLEYLFTLPIQHSSIFRVKCLTLVLYYSILPVTGYFLCDAVFIKFIFAAIWIFILLLIFLILICNLHNYLLLILSSCLCLLGSLALRFNTKTFLSFQAGATWLNQNFILSLGVLLTLTAIVYHFSAKKFINSEAR